MVNEGKYFEASMSDAAIKRFKKHIEKCGGSPLTPKSYWELIRFEDSGSIGIIYHNKKNKILKMNEVAEYHYFWFVKDEKNNKKSKKNNKLQKKISG